MSYAHSVLIQWQISISFLHASGLYDKIFSIDSRGVICYTYELKVLQCNHDRMAAVSCDANASIKFSGDKVMLFTRHRFGMEGSSL